MVTKIIPGNSNPWVCDINGARYVYAAGTEQEVPEAVGAVIDAYWESVEPPKASGGSSGGGVMIVDAVTADGSSYKTDKTFAQIEAAINAGTEVKVAAHYEDSSAKDWYSLSGTESGVAYFVSVKDLGLTGIGITTLGIYSDDSAHADVAEVAKTNPW